MPEDARMEQSELLDAEADGDGTALAGEQGAGAAGGGGASASSTASAAAAPPPPPGVREDARGDIYVAGRSAPVGKLTAWGNSISARCKLHNKCTRPYSYKQLPGPDTLKDWLCAGVGMQTAEEHMSLPKAIR